MTDFSNTPNPADTESSMFAPVPAWERSKKRRAFGRTAPRTEPMIAEETRSFAPIDPMTSRLDPMPGETATESAFAGTPTYASTTTVKRNNMAPMILGAGIVLIGGLAAAGWYYSQPHAAGVAELTPGVPAAITTTTTTEPTANTPPAPGESSQLAINAAPPAPAPVAKPATHTTTTTTLARRAPAPRPASRSVEDSSVNAAAQAPAVAPAPAAQIAPPQAPLVLTPAPTQSATPPAETTPAPAPESAPTETPPK